MSTVQARAGYIAKHQFGVHPALRFEFTPLDYESRLKIDKTQREAANNPEKMALLTFSTVKNNLASWEANQSHLYSYVPGSDEGATLPLSVGNIRQLQPTLVDRLFLIIMGISGSDPVPGANDEEVEDYAATLIAAAADGVSPGTAAEEREVGN